MHDPLSDADLERFVRGLLSLEERQRVLRHLLGSCAGCRERLGPSLGRLDRVAAEALVAGEPDSGYPESAYSAPLARARAAVLALRRPDPGEERRRLDGAFARVQSQPDGLLGLGLVTDEEMAELGPRRWLELLLRCSFAERYRNPRRMLDLALLARHAAEALDTAVYGAALVADERARAWAELANAHRVNDDLKAAEAAFQESFDNLGRGSGDLLVTARIGDLTASLYSDQRKFAAALEVLDRVIEIYREIGDEHLAGKVLVQRGLYTDNSGAPHAALPYLREGLARLDPMRDPQLVARSTQVLLFTQVNCGEYRQAARLLLASGLRQSLADEPLNLLKVGWVEGQVLAGLGKLRRAAAAFEEVRAGFFRYGQEELAALAGLDLVAVRLEQGRAAEVKELAQDIFFTFECLEIHEEAWRATYYLKRVCEEGIATPLLVRHVRRFLQRLQYQPHLRFEAVY